MKTIGGSQNSFAWNDLANWGHHVARCVPDSARENLLSSSRNRVSEFIHCDDQSFASAFLSEFADCDTIYRNIGHLLNEHYRYLQMFHCCRPISVASYYRDGIKTLDTEYANKLFQKIVRDNPAFSNVTSKQLQSAFEDMADSLERNGHVYFGLDDRFLIRYCPHYLNFGSEYFQALAVHIDAQANTNIKSFLQSNGKPTVFTANILFSKINAADLNVLASAVFTTWLYNYAHKTNTPFEQDFGISLTEDLSSEQIINHFHPD